MRNMSGWFEMVRCEVPRRCVVHLSILVMFFSGNLLAEGVDDFSGNYNWVVQVLTYKNDKLINQGTGFVAGDPAVVVTAAHLLEKGDAWFVVENDGSKHSASVQNKDQTNDVAILASGGLPNAAVLSTRNLRRGDTARIYGFWIDGLEEKRQAGILGFFNETLPDYIAKQIASQQYAITVVQGGGEKSQSFISQTGRGAFGSPLVNRCGQVAAFFGAPDNTPLSTLWKREKLDSRRTALTASTVTEILTSFGVNPALASEPCLEASELAIIDKEQAEKKAKQAQQAAKKAKKDAEEQRKKAEKAEEKAEQAQQEKEKEKEEKTAVVEQMAEVMDKEKDERSELKILIDDYKTYLIVGALVAGLIVLLLVLITRKRKSALTESQRELSQMSAPRTNYIFSGTDSQGNPIALKVLGSDLFKASNGLLLGRNPNSVQLVVADETVSRVHAKLMLKNNQLFIEDYGSSSGTSVDGIKVESSQVLEIRNGASVQLGDVLVVVRFEEPL
jgi:hypothetical protein